MSDKHEYSFVVKGKLALPYQYFAGTVGSRWLTALRDEKKILGQRCPNCKKVFVPPRATCERCFADLKDAWVGLAPEGEIVNFTVIRYAEPYQPVKPPYVLALIRLRGADTPLAHIIAGTDIEKVRIGMKVQAVFAEKRTGSLLDIARFAPV
jgi:hypothetical protein